MRERGGLLALFAAFSAASFHVGPAATAPMAPTESHSTTTASPKLQPSEESLLGVFREFDKGEKFDSPADLIKASRYYDWAIATVPDPEHSNLKLDFDREVESIQNAADAAGYQFERYWFPWRDEANVQKQASYSVEDVDPSSGGRSFLQIKSAEDSRREDLPGVLLFRQSGKVGAEHPALAIFLVGETPTSGIEPEQFKTALSYGQALPAPSNENTHVLRIIGPGYSGSFVSLARLIKTSREDSQSRFDSAVVRTWTSDFSSQDRFCNDLNQIFGNTACGDKTMSVPELKATSAPSVLSINRFANYIRGNWKENAPVVLLVEEGTGFAAGISAGINEAAGKKISSTGPNAKANVCTENHTRLDADKSEELPSDANKPEELWYRFAEHTQIQDCRVFVLKFPRNISALRTATEAEARLPGFSKESPQTEVPRIGLTLSLKADEHASSEIPRFSKQQTPVSQESILFSIGSLMKTDVVHYVGIMASDPLDTLFLSRYLKSVAPNLRVFTFDPDLLFEHGSDSDDFQGMLAVTEYPLFPMSQMWPRSLRSLHVFPSSIFEGMYNAGTSVFLTFSNSPISADPTSFPVDFRDYHHPFSKESDQDRYPPLWITVASRNGFEAVDVLPTPQSPYTLVVDPKPIPPGKKPIPDRWVPKFWPGWIYCFGILMLSCFFYCFFVARASPECKRAFTFLSTKSSENGSSRRAFYISSMGVALSLLNTISLFVAGTILQRNVLSFAGSIWTSPLTVAIVAFVVGVVLMLIFWRSNAKGRAASPPTKKSSGGDGPPPSNGSGSLSETPELAKSTVAGSSCLALPTIIQSMLDLFSTQSSPVLSQFELVFLFSFVVLGATVTASFLPVWEVIRRGNPLGPAQVNASPAGQSTPTLSWDLFKQAVGTQVYLRAAIVVLAIGLIVITCMWVAMSSAGPDQARRFFAACRAIDLTSGVSPLVPLSFLIFGLITLSVAQLRRVNYAEDRFPKTPILTLEIGDTVAEIQQRTSMPTCDGVHKVAIALALIVFFKFGFLQSHQTFEEEWLERLILGLAVASGLGLTIVCIHLLSIWSAFKLFLELLERHPLRTIFGLLPQGFVSSRGWQGAGQQPPYSIATRSLECLRALKGNVFPNPFRGEDLTVRREEFENNVAEALRILSRHCRVPSHLNQQLQENLLPISQAAVQYLEPKWKRGTYEQEDVAGENRPAGPGADLTKYDTEQNEKICEEIVGYRFLALIDYVVWQMDNLVGYISVGFLLLIIAMKSYLFRSSSIIDWILALMFIVISIVVVTVLAQANRDSVLSRIRGTKEGKLDSHFYSHLFTYGALPLVFLAASHFPTVGRFFFSWVKPALEAIH